ncbi:J domain-containing protein [Salinadaptatus halalkaliphilus]|uniref:J domain-containing protein n=1 Tax=Salinadaptatus halalkaliphilus TaxID=2419781 RepID=A0A4V3VLB3_9EURY|nr:J domain-containing protein [Salinadaptatus halalkaliphilus]THE65037.1 J domain-containing protein [Salinadaptatus halalkaliphilus]
MAESYYDVLEIDPDASRDEIQAAYRDRVLETHPDHNDAPNATEQFQRVARAKSVLTDGTERARYDRLGHDAYVRLAQYDGDSSSTGNDSSGESPSAGRSTTRRTEATSSAATERRTESAQDRSRTTTSRTASTRTTDRQQQRATTQKRQSRSFDADGTSSQDPTHERRRSADTPAEGDESAEFRYSVHDWDGEIDLEWEGQPLSHTTAVTMGCLWVLYPVLVTSSLTTLFPTVVNAILAACTLSIVAYVLLRPRIAAAVFGTWSLAFAVGMGQFDLAEPTSLRGLLALGFVWIPFGYALGLWWTLRP